MKTVYDNKLYGQYVVSEDKIYGGFELNIDKTDGSITIINEEYGIFKEFDKKCVDALREYFTEVKE